MLKVELKADSLSLAVAWPTDDFGFTKEQVRHPSFVDELTVEPNACNVLIGFEKVGNAVDEIDQPGGPLIALVTLLPVKVNLLEQML